MQPIQLLDSKDTDYTTKKNALLSRGFSLISSDINGVETWEKIDEGTVNAKGFQSAKEAHAYAAVTPGVRTEVETVFAAEGGGIASDPQTLQPTHEVFWTGNKGDPFNIRLLGNTQGGTNVLSSPYRENDNSLWVYNKQTGEKIRLTDAPEAGKPTGGDIVFLKTEALDEGKGGYIDFYSVDGVVKSYTRSAAETVIQGGEDKFKVDGGTFYQTSAGRYDFVPDPAKEFVPGTTVDIPGVGKMVQTSPNQYQVIEDTVEPGVVVDPVSGRRFIQRTDGNWGAEVAPRYPADVIEKEGMALLQQRSGDISQLAKPDLDQIITQALVDGEYDKAFAFQDFRDRPTAQETFQTALQFARSPADQILISSIARGEQTVQPPPPGTIQRVGPQPDFLVQAYQDFQRRTQAGRAPTEEEAITLSARAAAGQTPLTDTLQGRLEEMQEKMRRDEEVHQVKLEGLIREGERKEETWRQLFQQSEEKFEREKTKTVKSGDTETAATPETTASSVTPTKTTASVTPMTEEDEDEEWSKFVTEQNRAAVAADRTQQALDLGYSADAAAELVKNTPSGTPFSQALAMDLQSSLEDMGQANALDIITTGSQAGGVTSQLANLAGLSSALKADPTAVLTQAGSGGPSTFTPEGEIGQLRFEERAGGGTVQPGEITVVGEQGPEIAMMPPGTHILPLGRATKQDIKAAQSTGRAYQTGGIVFGELPFGLRQLQAGRPITPSRGYLSQAAGLTLPSAQAMSNITPESRDVFLDLAAQAGIPRKSFAQELASTIPSGRRMPVARIAPISRRGVQ